MEERMEIERVLKFASAADGVPASLPVPHSLEDSILFDKQNEEVVIYAGPDIEPIQVKVLARLSPGIGDRIYETHLASMQRHPRYLYEEGEHSALIFGASVRDESALYTLAVGREPLSWHRHPSCAHRIITLTTGSGGAIVRFNLASDAEIERGGTALLSKMIVVELPSDSLCCIRFNGATYHQFGPRDEIHPAFSGNSVHANERGEIKEVYDEGWDETNHRDSSEVGSIPLLTKCLARESGLMMERLQSTGCALTISF